MKKIDIHDHILPEIDDGAKSLEQALVMLELAAEDGIQEIIATPHFHYKRGRAKPEKILQKLAELQAAADAQNIPVRLHAGNELYYTQELLDVVKAGEALTMAGSEYVLLEFSPDTDARKIQNAVYQFMAEGYAPIIAHVERYEAFTKNIGFALEISEMGAYFQCNAGLFTKRFQWSSKRFAESLIEHHAVQFLATDAHDIEKRAPQFGKTVEKLVKKYGTSEVRAMVYKNAKKIIEHQMI